MSPIIRNAELSSRKRTLPQRRPSSGVETRQSAAAEDGVSSVRQLTAPAAEQATPLELPRVDQQQLQELFEKARQSVLDQFKGEAESARELGRQRGLQEGRQAGREELRQMVASDLGRLRSIMDGLQAKLNSGIEEMEDIALAIAFEALCKILGTSAVTEEVVKAQIRHAASRVQAHENLLVCLHPADLDMLKGMGGLDSILPSGKSVTWESDKSVELGGCILKTDGGQLDARFETQLEQLKKILFEVRARAAD